ncbi:MAG: DUF3852 family protein [Lachnospiraceae bacterium]|nr:DUF3852 family protein [Lachnospiraceae bacterium]
MGSKFVFLTIAEAISQQVNKVKAEIRASTEAIFPLLTGVLAIVFVITVVVEGYLYKKRGHIDWEILLIELICLVVCGGGAAFSFALGGW